MPFTPHCGALVERSWQSQSSICEQLWASHLPLPVCQLPHLQNERVDQMPSQAPSHIEALSCLLNKCRVIKGSIPRAELLSALPSLLPPRLPPTTLLHPLPYFKAHPPGREACTDPTPTGKLSVWIRRKTPQLFQTSAQHSYFFNFGEVSNTPCQGVTSQPTQKKSLFCFF